MDFLKCSQCSSEVHLFRELAGIDRAAGYVSDNVYVVSEWKDTGHYEVTDEWWQCSNGHTVQIDMVVEE